MRQARWAGLLDRFQNPTQVIATGFGAAALLGRSLRGALAYAAPMGYLVAAVVAGSFVACSVLAALDFAGTWPHAPSGLLERVALFAGLGWLGGVGVHLHRHGDAVTAPEGDTAETAAGG